MRSLRLLQSERHVLVAAVAVVMATAAVLALLTRSSSETVHTPSPALPSEIRTPIGPPWIYGRADARFTLIEYAELECPYCRAYFPVLRKWIDANPDVNWQWHHLPLSMHDPVATQAAHLAECVGERDGNTAFWNTIAWIYQRSCGNGAGLAEPQFPAVSAAAQDCQNTGRLLPRIQAQVAAAAREGIAATPTLRLVDNETGRTFTLQGMIEGDALLSAIDRLTSPSDLSPGPE